jgi:hypothetical protein
MVARILEPCPQNQLLQNQALTTLASPIPALAAPCWCRKSLKFTPQRGAVLAPGASPSPPRMPGAFRRFRACREIHERPTQHPVCAATGTIKPHHGIRGVSAGGSRSSAVPPPPYLAFPPRVQTAASHLWRIQGGLSHAARGGRSRWRPETPQGHRGGRYRPAQPLTVRASPRTAAAPPFLRRSRHFGPFSGKSLIN